MQRLQIEFLDKTSDIEVSQQEYENMLGSLPPERLVYNAFLVGEISCHDRQNRPLYSLYYEDNGRYFFHATVTTKDFDLFTVPVDEK